MPWHREAMKDVVTCDKPRVVGNKPSVDLRMGKPCPVNPGNAELNA